MEIEARIKKTLSLFADNIRLLDGVELTSDEKKIVEMSKMYASDSEVFLRKEDFYTSFSAIEYAHGLLDAVLKIKNKKE